MSDRARDFLDRISEPIRPVDPNRIVDCPTCDGATRTFDDPAECPECGGVRYVVL